MGLKTGLSIVLVAAALTAAFVAGCGDGGSNSSSTSSSAADSTSNPSADSTSNSSQTEVSAEFLGKGPNGQIAKFGQEADAAEREAASAVLEESLKARAAGDWAGQCSTLTVSLAKEVAKTSKGACAKGLEAEAAPAPAYILKYTMTGPIDVLRVQGSEAFALYHGTKGVDYTIPMKKEGEEWKVASLTTQRVP